MAPAISASVGGGAGLLALDLIEERRVQRGGRGSGHERDLGIGQALFERGQHGDGMALAASAKEAFDGPAAFDVAGGIGERADDCDLLDRCGQRQSMVIVLEQNHGAAGEFAFEREACGAVEHRVHFGGVDVGVVKKAELVFGAQNRQHGGVDFGLG